MSWGLSWSNELNVTLRFYSVYQLNCCSCLDALIAARRALRKGNPTRFSFFSLLIRYSVSLSLLVLVLATVSTCPQSDASKQTKCHISPAKRKKRTRCLPETDCNLPTSHHLDCSDNLRLHPHSQVLTNLSHKNSRCSHCRFKWNSFATSKLPSHEVSTLQDRSPQHEVISHLKQARRLIKKQVQVEAVPICRIGMATSGEALCEEQFWLFHRHFPGGLHIFANCTSSKACPAK